MFPDEIIDGNAHLIVLEKRRPDGEMETRKYVLIPYELLTEADLDRIMRIRQMNYPDKQRE